MLTVEAIGESSPLMDAVNNLWGTHRKTLGFLTGEAFRDYARGGRLLVATDGNNCLGYVLYRNSKNRISIAHFCVAPEFRKQGVAKAMLKRLIKTTQQYRGIFLKCREDYDAGL